MSQAAEERREKQEEMFLICFNFLFFLFFLGLFVLCFHEVLKMNLEAYLFH